MKLTPLDIHHKEFHRSMRGYNEEEVDVFLDEVADEFERLFKENVELQQQIEKLNEKMEQYKVMEQTLQNTLFTAQKTAEELTNNARKESELILRDAELKAKDMIQQALAEKQRIQQIFLRIKQAEEEFRVKFRGLLEDYGNLIKEIPVPEDILLLTAPSEDGEDPAAAAAALVLDRPAAEMRMAEDLGAPIAAAEAAEEPVATEPAASEPVEMAEAAEAVPEPAEPAEAAAPAVAEAAEPASAEDTAEIPPAAEPAAAAPASEPLLSSEVTTVSSDDGHVRGLTLGEVESRGGELGDDIDLPDFLKDPLDRTDEERDRLRSRDSGGGGAAIPVERDDEADIEEIS